MTNIFDINDGVLVHCTVNEPNVTIPDGVKTIAGKAFSIPDDFHGQDALQCLTIPKSVETIESGAFKYCERLKKVSILGPASIGREAFLSCSNLKEVYLAEGVRSIGSECFAYCDKIEYLFIPQSVTHIGWDIARMNDSSYRNPVFRCYAKGNGEDWDDDWNRIYNDPRFGSDRNYSYYHPTYYGVNRNGTPRQGYKLAHTVVNDMPHGTGEKSIDSKNRAESHRLPKTKLRLWLNATIISMVGDNEYMLDDEEREMLPNTLRDNIHAPKHLLDQPWEITVDDDTRHLTPELKISAWINDFYDYFDGHTLVVHHDMPSHNDPYSNYPVSKLTPGSTVIAEKYFDNGGTTYDVRLNIQWVEQESTKYTLDEALCKIRMDKEHWPSYKDSENEYEILLAHRHWKAEKYRTYKPSEFPDKFIEDINGEGDKWSDLGQIVVQPYEFYEEEHSFSDDYKDAASAYGEDCDDWTTTERRKCGNKFCYEIKY